MSRMKKLKIRLDVLGGPLENKCLKIGAESTTLLTPTSLIYLVSKSCENNSEAWH